MRIAIIGAGMAGLTCGMQLVRAGHAVQLFDKGRGPGGRMATRRMEHEGAQLRFDHGAQYFTARDAAFVDQVAAWESAGVVARWPAAGEDAWVGTPGMNAPIRAMGEALDVRFGARVETLERDGAQWSLHFEDSAVEAGFDAAIVAVPAEQAAVLLGEHAPEMAALAGSVESAPCWTVMAAFAKRVSLEADTLRDAGAVGWAARNSSKPERDGSTECWVVQGSPAWSAQHLEQSREWVQAELLSAFADYAGELPETLSVSAHRWRYAMVERREEGALWDADVRIGACGDWLSGPRVENAFLGGRELAERIGSDG